MSATIVTTFMRAPVNLNDGEQIAHTSDADLRRKYGLVISDNQLWERVAELAASGINYTERMERVKTERIRRAYGYDAQATGEYVKAIHSTRRSGILGPSK